ncbi:hypothetical protein EVAR_9966_1 [Eumeta japonica]|uniref:Uncharacterized protein n=1 Tax=Eumeta variegata TaxID=151549 RepID=A0A4C1TQW9_EUMVA|nr:hypothetical protein EVAR_9966_1 [Eumeta japonica]
MGPPDGGSPNLTLKIPYWKKVSTALEKIDNPTRNSISDDISTSDEIDSAIDEAGIAKYLADSIKSQCSHASPPHDIAHIKYIVEEVQNKTSLEPKTICLPSLSAKSKR